MKKSRFTEEQIAFALKQAETGTPVAEVAAPDGHHRADILPLEEALRRFGHGRTAAAEAARGREPQAQAARGRSEPRQAHPAGRARKKALTPARRRDLVHQVQEAHWVSERRGCVALGVGRSSIRYRSTKPGQAPLRMRICDLAKSRVSDRTRRSATSRLRPRSSSGQRNRTAHRRSRALPSSRDRRCTNFEPGPPNGGRSLTHLDQAPVDHTTVDPRMPTAETTAVHSFPVTKLAKSFST